MQLLGIDTIADHFTVDACASSETQCILTTYVKRSVWVCWTCGEVDASHLRVHNHYSVLSCISNQVEASCCTPGYSSSIGVASYSYVLY